MAVRALRREPGGRDLDRVIRIVPPQQAPNVLFVVSDDLTGSIDAAAAAWQAGVCVAALPPYRPTGMDHYVL